MRQVPSDEVRRKWRDLVDGVMTEGAHICVLRSGKPVAVIVSVGWYESTMATLGEAQQ